MFVVLDHIEQLRPDIWTFWVTPERPLRFIAGQYVELFIPHQTVDDRGQHRWLTISSTPQSKLIGLTTKFPPKSSTYKNALKDITPGTQLHISEPIGDFVLPKLQSIPVILVAAGIGITPMKSMVADMTLKGEIRPLQLIHIGRTAGDLLFEDEFLDANITYYQMLTQPPKGWSGLSGYITGERVLKIADTAAIVTPNDDTLYFLSGPEKLVMNIHDELLLCGIQRSQIVLDYFPGYTSL